jgi:hypothetical protein
LDFTPVDIGDLDLSGLSRDDILAALIDAAIIGAPDEAEFSAAEKSPGELPAHENATGELAPPENGPTPGLSKSTVSGGVPFYSPDQLRDERGRWTAGGASGGMTRQEHAARREAASSAIRDYLTATHQPTREETARLAGHLATLTVKQLHELRKEHGLKDPRLLKEDFVNALHGYFQAHREKQAVLARGREDEARRQAEKQGGADFATRVVEAAKSLPNTFGNARDPGSEKWMAHKVYISELYDHLKPTLGGMGLEDFKRKLLESHLGGKLTLLRDDIAGTQSLAAGAKHAASEIQHLNATFHTVDAHGKAPAAPGARPEPHQALAAAVAGKKGFTQPFRRGPYVAVRHDPTGHIIEAEAGNHSGRFAVKDPSNVVHSRHDTAEAAVAAVQSANRLGTGDSTVERELRDRAAQAGKGDAAGHQARVEQEFNRLLPAARGGLVSIPELRRRLGLNPADFERAVRELDRSDRLRLVATGDRSRHTKEELSAGIEGENETFMYVEPGPHHAVAAVQSANRLGTGDSTVERELRDRAAQAGKGTFDAAAEAKAIRALGDRAIAELRPVNDARHAAGGMNSPPAIARQIREVTEKHIAAGEQHFRDLAARVKTRAQAQAVARELGLVAERGSKEEILDNIRKTFRQRIGTFNRAELSAGGPAPPDPGAAHFDQGGLSILTVPGEGDVADLIPASVPFSADPGGQDEGRFVLKDAPVVFRAGPYDFPPEKGGPFEMTPEDIRQALEDFPPDGVEITNEHNSRCIFQGKLGRFLMPRPSPDYATFGGKVKLARPVLDLLGTGPIKLSANWDRATKRLKDVSLVANPRITDAALFAAFAKDAEEGGTEKYATPHGRASMQAMHDLAARSGALCKSPAGVPPGASDRSAAAKPREAGMAAFTSGHERDALQAIHDTAAGMGASCAVAKLPKRAQALEAMMSEYVPTPVASPREQELERQLTESREREAKFNERLAAVEKANQEAQFSAAVARLEAEAVAFVNANTKRLYGKRDRDAVAAMYVAAGRASIGTTAEVQFSDEKGGRTKGSLLDAFRASILARPEHGLDTEQVPGPLTVLFGGETKDPEDAETERLRKAMEERAAAQNARNGGRR